MKARLKIIGGEAGLKLQCVGVRKRTYQAWFFFFFVYEREKKKSMQEPCINTHLCRPIPNPGLPQVTLLNFFSPELVGVYMFTLRHADRSHAAAPSTQTCFEAWLRCALERGELRARRD